MLQPAPAQEHAAAHNTWRSRAGVPFGVAFSAVGARHAVPEVARIWMTLCAHGCDRAAPRTAGLRPAPFSSGVSLLVGASAFMRGEERLQRSEKAPPRFTRFSAGPQARHHPPPLETPRNK